MQVDLGKEEVGAIAVDRPGVSPVIDAPGPYKEPPVRSTGKADSSPSGYCLWEFDGAAWLLKKDRCAAGHVPSPPPSVPGRFRGQLRAVMAVPETSIVGEQAAIVPDTKR
jgi:hypothetical protein